MPPAARLPLLNGLLLVLVFASAFAVIGSTHRSRALYAELQRIEAERWDLDEEYSRLLLEQGTWASYHRIAREAQAALGLAPPAHHRTSLLRP